MTTVAVGPRSSHTKKKEIVQSEIMTVMMKWATLVQCPTRPNNTIEDMHGIDNSIFYFPVMHQSLEENMKKKVYTTHRNIRVQNMQNQRVDTAIQYDQRLP